MGQRCRLRGSPRPTADTSHQQTSSGRRYSFHPVAPPQLDRETAGFIIAFGIFAALNQLQIAPEIVNGLYYAVLALIVGSGIIAMGGGRIAPMRQQWERALTKIEEEAPKVREASQKAEQLGNDHPGDGSSSARTSPRG